MGGKETLRPFLFGKQLSSDVEECAWVFELSKLGVACSDSGSAGASWCLKAACRQFDIGLASAMETGMQPEKTDQQGFWRRA